LQKTRLGRALGLSVLVGLVLATGCVERRLLVRSDPPESEIFLDGQLVGRTDASGELEIGFDYYGTRVLVARSPGFVPGRMTVEVDPPWYQLFPLGLFSEVLWPGTIHDDHPVPIKLERRAGADDAARLEGQARQFRENQERRQ
jgi:hypothetical protein